MGWFFLAVILFFVIAIAVNWNKPSGGRQDNDDPYAGMDGPD